MFKIGDKIAYPMHGAGVIEGVESRCILGQEHKYYVLKLSMGNVQVLIPTSNMEETGVRYIVSADEADHVIHCFAECAEEDEDKNWNKRYRDNIEKLKKGNLEEVAVVMKSLVLRDRRKSLSNAERKMLNNAKNALISELGLSKGMSYDEVEHLLMDAIS
ncbi:CarD family transcriptional regulator [Ructibacterium gallinarum]|uniref:CarD family transcriptional regulator n=1 Tax=Ructibacterium gallinarum TaxID=2779355 RepID=A0A9D5R8U6_9FIRM|nr:CarD family transcriptional regulator [Ructibacterium gallinarum]MBE5040375.1 CarD family transcriptional regulator [Ructibacterium gallinarum]